MHDLTSKIFDSIATLKQVLEKRIKKPKLKPSKLFVFVVLGLLLSSSLLLFGTETASAPSGPWISDEWEYRRKITIDAPMARDNYEVKLSLDPDAYFRKSSSDPDWSDIRFTNESGEFLDHWLEPDFHGWDEYDDGIFYVRIPQLQSGTNTIYVFYGNSNASSQSDPYATFQADMFDDFTKYTQDTQYEADSEMGNSPWYTWAGTGGSTDDYAEFTNNQLHIQVDTGATTEWRSAARSIPKATNDGYTFTTKFRTGVDGEKDQQELFANSDTSAGRPKASTGYGIWTKANDDVFGWERDDDGGRTRTSANYTIDGGDGSAGPWYRRTLQWAGDSGGDNQKFWIYDYSTDGMDGWYIVGGDSTYSSFDNFQLSGYAGLYDLNDYYWDYVFVRKYNEDLSWTLGSEDDESPKTSNVMVEGFSSGTEGIQHITDHSPVIEWSFSDPNNSQQAYEVEVWNESGGTGTNMLDTGSVSSSTKSHTYNGSSLQDGATYYARVRTQDADEWSNWSETEFRMNTDPNPPTDLTPSDKVSTTTVDLGATVSDNESDSMDVYFYDDSDDSLIGIDNGVSSGGKATVTWSGLAKGNSYSFYVKANDGFETGNASSVQTFTVTPPNQWFFDNWSKGKWDTSITPYSPSDALSLIGKDSKAFWQFEDDVLDDITNDSTSYNNHGTMKTGIWLDGWSYRRKITIDAPQARSDYELKLSLDPDAYFRKSSSSPDWSDMRFMNESGQLLDYWREPGYEADAYDDGTFYVRIPQLESGTNIIYVFYGNSSASSISDPYATFQGDMFDDFTKWNTGSEDDGQVTDSPWYTGNGDHSSYVEVTSGNSLYFNLGSGTFSGNRQSARRDGFVSDTGYALVGKYYPHDEDYMGESMLGAGTLTSDDDKPGDAYTSTPHTNQDYYDLWRWDDGGKGATYSGPDPGTLDKQKWYRQELTWEGNDFDLSLYDYSDGTGGSVLSSFSETDSTYSSFNKIIISQYTGGACDIYWDYVFVKKHNKSLSYSLDDETTRAEHYPDQVSGKSGSALTFDGEGGYARVSDSSSLSVTGDLTISFWMKPTNISKGRQTIIEKAYDGEFEITLEDDGGMSFYHGNGTDYYNGADIYPSGTFNNNEWFHVTVTRSTSDDTIKVYKNGEQVNSDTFSYQPSSTSQDVIVGSREVSWGWYPHWYKGKIDELAIFDRTLTKEEVKSLWATGTAYYPFETGFGSTVYDSFGNNGGTINGAKWSSQGYYDNTLDFDGSDNVEVPHNSNLNITDEITLDAWIYPDTFSGEDFIVNKYDWSNSTGYSLGLDSGQLLFKMGDGSSLHTLRSNSMSTGEWHHVIGTYDGSTMKVYVDGQEEGANSVSFTIDPSTNPLVIGEASDSSGYYFDGKIDEVRVFSKALTPEQVSMIAYDEFSDLKSGKWSAPIRDMETNNKAGVENVHFYASLGSGEDLYGRIRVDEDDDGLVEDSTDWTLLNGMLDGEDGAWSIPNVPNGYRFQVEFKLVADSTISSSTVLDNYTLLIDNIPPNVSISQPYEGIEIKGGTSYTIKWNGPTDDNPDNVKIENSFNGGTNWSNIVLGESDDGSYTWNVPTVTTSQAKIQLTATDKFGFTGSDNTGTFIIDSTSPATPSNISASPSSWTNENSFDISWNNPSDLTGISGAYYKLDSTPNNQTDGTFVSGDNITNISNISVSGDGEHDIYVWLKDGVGNIDHGNAASTTLKLDTTSPNAPENISASPSSWSTDNSFDISWDNPSDLSGISGAYYSLDSPPSGSTDGTLVDINGIDNISNISVSGDGEHDIYVWLKDGVGNIDHGNRTSTTLKLDTTNPGSWQNGPSGWKTTQTPDVSIDVKDVTSGLDISTAEYRYSTDGGSSWSSWNSASSTGTDGTTSLETITASNVQFNQDSETQNKIEFRVTDIAGLTAACSQKTVKIDSTAPSSTPGNLHPTEGVSVGEPITFKWSKVTDSLSGLASYTIQVDNNSDFSSPIVYENTKVMENSHWYGFSDYGDHYWRVKAVDNAGNETSWSSELKITRLSGKTWSQGRRGLRGTGFSPAFVPSETYNIGLQDEFSTEYYEKLSGIAVRDVTGDGRREKIFGTKSGTLYVVDEDNNLVWSFNAGGKVYCSPAVGDVDSDGSMEIIISSKENESIYALNGEDGTVLWRFETGNYPQSSPIIVDADGDSDSEVIFNLADDDDTKGMMPRVFALNGEDGSKIWSYSVNISVWSKPAFADVDSDGGDEVVFGSQNGNVYILSAGNGSLEDSYNVGGSIYTSVPIVDLTGDGDFELVVATYNDGVLALDAGSGSVIWSAGGVTSIMGDPAVHDIDSDGVKEVVVASRWGEKVCALDSGSGSEEWSFSTNNGVLSSPVVGDVDGDKKMEVMFGTDGGVLYLLNGEDGSQVWSYSVGYKIRGEPVLAYSDSDKYPEIILPGRGSGIPLRVLDIS